MCKEKRKEKVGVGMVGGGVVGMGVVDVGVVHVESSSPQMIIL